MDEEQAVFEQFTLSDFRCGVPQHKSPLTIAA